MTEREGRAMVRRFDRVFARICVALGVAPNVAPVAVWPTLRMHWQAEGDGRETLVLAGPDADLDTATAMLAEAGLEPFCFLPAPTVIVGRHVCVHVSGELR